MLGRLLRREGQVSHHTIPGHVVNLSKLLLRDGSGEPLLVLTLIEDVTEQRNMVREIIEAKEIAENATRAKSDFLANMSHELRTPLNIIVGYSELLEEDAEDDGNKKLIIDLKKIQSAATHQLTLINSILDISKIEEGQLDIHPVDFDVESSLTININATIVIKLVKYF